MSRDSSPTYIHLSSSRHADLFEEFCRPPSLTANANSSHPSQATTNLTMNTSTGPSNDPLTGMITLPGTYLPFEEIHLPPHLQPLNPEDEDDVVPDMHAAFGINRALGQNQSGSGAHAGSTMRAGEGEASMAGAQREPAWQDLGLERLVGEAGINLGKPASGNAIVAKVGSRREGSRSGLLFLR